jgi:hypothetical protein
VDNARPAVWPLRAGLLFASHRLGNSSELFCQYSLFYPCRPYAPHRPLCAHTQRVEYRCQTPGVDGACLHRQKSLLSVLCATGTGEPSYLCQKFATRSQPLGTRLSIVCARPFTIFAGHMPRYRRAAALFVSAFCAPSLQASCALSPHCLIFDICIAVCFSFSSP